MSNRLGGTAWSAAVLGSAEPSLTVLALVVLGPVAITLLGLYVVLTKCLHVVPPNQLLVLSGRKRVLPDGTVVGYRTVRGGRVIRIPLLETAHVLDLTVMVVEVDISNVFTRGGQTVPMTIAASVRISTDEPMMHNAVERFLGTPRERIIEVIRQTLEGVVRGIASTATAEALQYERDGFSDKVRHEVEPDLSHLGLVIETLRLQRVGAEVATYRGPRGR